MLGSNKNIEGQLPLFADHPINKKENVFLIKSFQEQRKAAKADELIEVFSSYAKSLQWMKNT